MQQWCTWYRSAMFLEHALAPSSGLHIPVEAGARLWVTTTIAPLARSFFVDDSRASVPPATAVTLMRRTLDVVAAQLPVVATELHEYGGGVPGLARVCPAVLFPHTLPMLLWDGVLAVVPSAQRTGPTFALAVAFVRTCLARAFEAVHTRLVAFVDPLRAHRTLRPTEANEAQWALLRVVLCELLGVLSTRCAPIGAPGARPRDLSMPGCGVLVCFAHLFAPPVASCSLGAGPSLPLAPCRGLAWPLLATAMWSTLWLVCLLRFCALSPL